MYMPSFETLTEDDNYLANLGHGIWLMDDHRWALKVWETERKSDCYVLIHADYHWDGCYDYHNDSDQEGRLVNATPAEVSEIVRDGTWIRYDSFIAPAIRRGLVRTVHFYCLQDDAGDDAIDEEFLARCGAKQVIHPDAASLVAADIDGPLIFDLCLDLFNRSKEWTEGDLWEDSKIISFLNTVEPLIRTAEMVTISMSFNYSGTVADTRHLTRLVVPHILALRHNA